VGGCAGPAGPFFSRLSHGRPPKEEEKRGRRACQRRRFFPLQGFGPAPGPPAKLRPLLAPDPGVRNAQPPRKPAAPCRRSPGAGRSPRGLSVAVKAVDCREPVAGGVFPPSNPSGPRRGISPAPGRSGSNRPRAGPRTSCGHPNDFGRRPMPAPHGPADPWPGKAFVCRCGSWSKRKRRGEPKKTLNSAFEPFVHGQTAPGRRAWP